MIEGVKNGFEAISLLKLASYELLIIDLILPRVGGEEILEYLEGAKPEYLRRVIVTTTSSRQLSCEFLKRICRLLEKPFDIHQLVLYARECRSDQAA